MPAAKILPGEYYVTNGNELVTTVLGSCVSACIRDRVFGIGGMNHFMLPISTDGKGWNGAADVLSTATRYGNYAMEHMINDILKNGGHKRHLEAKIFGGGRMMKSLSDVGAKNIQFVREYLEVEGIPLIGENVGDIYPRKVIYIPSSGKVLMKRLKHLHNDTIIKREDQYRTEITHQPVAGSVELF
ncbi:MAG: chemoreceptor glutamine deamidase CheD [Gammaproteobacteria bacterium]|nr:chemoreceptor glutamine deamidase CheD [Gammaproteobacteria bacterium]MCB1925041.1 chemoreceptor glutamine deamidase CheD [Gammaproteobacteria bacterium]